MTKLLISIVLLLGLLTATALADNFNEDLIVDLCVAETDDGVCEVGGVDLFAVVVGFKQYTFFFSETGVGATCDIFVGNREVNGVVDLDQKGDQITATPLSSTNATISVEAPFYIMWVKCTAGDGAHSVTIQASN